MTGSAILGTIIAWRSTNKITYTTSRNTSLLSVRGTLKLLFADGFSDNLQTKVLGSCGLAQLTVKGDLQSETLGRLLRKRYVRLRVLLKSCRYIDGLQAMKENFDSDDYYIRSTDTSRTIWTARQMWKGLYPDSSRAEEGTTEEYFKLLTSQMFLRLRCCQTKRKICIRGRVRRSPNSREK